MDKSFFQISVNKAIEVSLLEEKHAPEMFALIEANRESLRQWLPWVDTTLTLDDSKTFIMRATDQFYSDTGIHCAVFYEGRMAGIIGCVKMDLGNRCCEIGYWLGDIYRGRGLMTTVCSAMLEYLFDSLLMNRVEIRCAVDNMKSIAIPIRLGFQKEGVLRQAAWLNDRFIDLAVYGMLSEEWLRRKKAGQNWP